MELLEEVRQAPEEQTSTEKAPIAVCQHEYTEEYRRTEGYMLVHVCRPSPVSKQKFDIFIFVVRHRKRSQGPPQRKFDEIQKADPWRFLGEQNIYR
jgi:hypothetical protein